MLRELLPGLTIMAALLFVVSAAHGQYLETTIPVGDTPANVLWNPVSNKVYCTNNQDDNVTIIDGETNQVIATVEVGEYPTFLTWNSRNNKVYVSCGEDNKVAVIDGQGDSLLRMPRVRGWPGHTVYNATMNKLYVACYDNDRVTVLDAGPDTVIKNIDVKRVGRLLWHPVTNRVFCHTDADADTMKVIDCTTDEIVVRMPLPTGTHGLGRWCWNPVNNLVYLASRYSAYAFAANGDSVVAEVPGWANLFSAVPFPNKLYVSGQSGIRVVDCNTHVVTETIPGVAGPLLCDTVLGKVYCSSAAERVYIIDARADTLIKSIPLGRYPYFLCWNRTNSRVYITDGMDDVVYVIRDTTSGITEQEFHVGPSRPPAATLVSQSYVHQETEEAGLVDACGRRVAVMEPGHNDLGRLAPGVYALVSADGALRCKIVKVR